MRARDRRVIGAVLLVVGLILLLMGINASNSPAEEIAESFTGRYSDQTIFYIVGGAAGFIAGLMLMIRR